MRLIRPTPRAAFQILKSKISRLKFLHPHICERYHSNSREKCDLRRKYLTISSLCLISVRNTGHDLVFTVTGSITGSTSVKYDLALANITPGATLTAEHIKFNLKKGDTYLIGTANTGVTVASRATEKGTLITSGYLLDTDTLT